MVIIIIGLNTMTINDLLIEAEQYQLYIVLYLLIVPAISFIYNLLNRPELRISSPHKYVYSALIYAAAIPGSIGFVLTAYTLFISRGNLLEVNYIIYFLTVISMAASFIIISKETDLKQIPGFDRIAGLFTMLVVSMFCVLMLMKVRIFVGFFASFEYLIAGIVIIFVLLKTASLKVFGESAKEKS